MYGPRMKTLAVVLCVAALSGWACDKKSDPGAPVSPAAALPAGSLTIQDLKIGEGAVATKGKTVSVHYTGTLTDGKKFDSSVDRGEPIVFPLGAGVVIKGWEQGLEGMRVGGKRKLTIPPALGYGAQGKGSVPPNATMIFDVELVGVQ
jgi:FKBP-type peptidyl-prolyl cis-trans isomerase